MTIRQTREELKNEKKDKERTKIVLKENKVEKE